MDIKSHVVSEIMLNIRNKCYFDRRWTIYMFGGQVLFLFYFFFLITALWNSLKRNVIQQIKNYGLMRKKRSYYLAQDFMIVLSLFVHFRLLLYFYVIRKKKHLTKCPSLWLRILEICARLLIKFTFIKNTIYTSFLIRLKSGNVYVTLLWIITIDVLSGQQRSDYVL